MSCGQRLFVVDVEPGAGDVTGAQRREQRVLIDDRPARGVDKERRRLHQGQLPRADQPGRPPAELVVHRDDIGDGEQFVLADRRDAGRRRGLRPQVLAPGEHLHAERLADPRHGPTDVPEPDDAERPAAQPEAHRVLPAAAPDGGVLLRDVPRHREDQRPGQFRRRAGRAGRAADCHSGGRAGRHVDRGVAHPRGDEQPQVRQQPDPLRGERRPLAHRHDDVERPQFGREISGVSDVTGERDDLRSERFPAGTAERRVLVVIEYRDLQGNTSERLQLTLSASASSCRVRSRCYGFVMVWLDLNRLADKAIDKELPAREEALAVLASPDDDLLDVIAAAFRVRRHFFGRGVKLNYLVNIKSGLCPEDCFYCSQRAGSSADVLKYTWLKADEVVASAEAGVAGGARRVCLVASGRGPTDRDIDRVATAVSAFKDRNPDVEVCACLGLLSAGQAERLAAAGTTAYNHNLNTSGGHYADICATHEYADRVATVGRAHDAGLSACSGLIAGMGETDEDLVDVAFALRALDPDSVPVNFLIPFEGTPLAGTWTLTPQRCLRILAMVRFTCPDAEVRIAGGREIHLRTLQPLALHIANSMFLGDYLTSEGQAGQADLEMIADAGFTVEGAAEQTLPAHRADLVRTRHRGAGTDLPANTALPASTAPAASSAKAAGSAKAEAALPAGS